MEQLGVELQQLITQIINFAILLFLLTKFLYKPILKALNERKTKIAEGLEYAEKMKKEDEKTELKRQEIVKEAKIEAKKIIEEAKKDAKKQQSDILDKANSEALEIKAKARLELESERLLLEKELKTKTVEIAKIWVESVIGKFLEDKKQLEIVNKKIAEMSKMKTS